MSIPIITIDGPSGTGKGTVAHRISKALAWHILDSGILYRVLAFFAKQESVDLDDEKALVILAAKLPVLFDDLGDDVRVILSGIDVTTQLRTEMIASFASQVAALKKVREALLDWQRAFVRLPGLVTDGRDMGTVVFPEADVKFFLDASVEERAKRRTKQLQGRGINVTLARVLDDFKVRDERDRNRDFAPLKSAEDAIVVDTTNLSVDEVYAILIQAVKQRLPHLKEH